MKKSDIENIQSYYTEFNDLLFNGFLPPASKINFVLHSIVGALGYSKYSETPTKNGNHHTIAFCKWYDMSQKLIKETLIHEMIHLWQVYSVKKDRYSYCSNDIAHDRVFRGKMATINLILKKNCYDLNISLTYNGNVSCEMPDMSKTPFTILFIEKEGEQYIDKVDSKSVDEYLKDLFKDLKNTEHKVFSIDTTDPIFNNLILKNEYDGNLHSPIIEDIDTFEQYEGAGNARTIEQYDGTGNVRNK